MRLLDLFCGRWGWSKAFAARGWECVGVDLVEPPEIPQGCQFYQLDVVNIYGPWLNEFDFICASSPCEQFSVHGMKHFHPNPPYPELGIKLFNHTRQTVRSIGRAVCDGERHGSAAVRGQGGASIVARSICGGMECRRS